MDELVVNGFAKKEIGGFVLLDALQDILIDIWVPQEWCSSRVVHGKTLVSVLCQRQEEFFGAIGVLTFTGASDISWSVPLVKSWEH